MHRKVSGPAWVKPRASSFTETKLRRCRDGAFENLSDLLSVGPSIGSIESEI